MSIGRERSYLARTTLLVLHIRHDALQSFLWVGRVISATIFEVCDSLPLGKNSLWGKLNVYWEAITTTSLPAGLTNPARSNFVKVSSWVGHFIRTKSNNQWGYIVWLESLYHLFWHNGAGHCCSGIGGNGVNVDVVLGTFTSESARETKNTTFLYKC